MSLKQIKVKKRIDFLKAFSSELLINSIKSEIAGKKIRDQIALEKLRIKFFTEKKEPEINFLEAQNSPIFSQPIYQEPKIDFINLLKKKRFTFNRKKAPKKLIPQTVLHKKLVTQNQNQLNQRLAPPHIQEQNPPRKLRPPKKIIPVLQQEDNSEKFFESKANQESPHKKYHSDPLYKLRHIINDPLVLSIECSGPDKRILLKKYGGVNVVNVKLDQKEISNIINDFSQRARIPVVGGILKAAVGSLIISAVSSKFVGSRFIINKSNPSNRAMN